MPARRRRSPRARDAARARPRLSAPRDGARPIRSRSSARNVQLSSGWLLGSAVQPLGAPDDTRDQIERAAQRLLVDASEVAAQDADADQLHAAEEEHRGEDPDLHPRRERPGGGEEEDDERADAAHEGDERAEV